MENRDLASLVLPEGLLERFDVIKIEEDKSASGDRGEYHIWLDEKNIQPSTEGSYESKGFGKSKKIQDFPIRGKFVFLHVRRRIWRDKEDSKKVIKSDYRFTAKGVKLTEELADFLKG